MPHQGSKTCTDRAMTTHSLRPRAKLIGLAPANITNQRKFKKNTQRTRKTRRAIRMTNWTISLRRTMKRRPKILMASATKVSQTDEGRREMKLTPTRPSKSVTLG